MRESACDAKNILEKLDECNASDERRNDKIIIAVKFLTFLGLTVENVI